MLRREQVTFNTFERAGGDYRRTVHVHGEMVLREARVIDRGGRLQKDIDADVEVAKERIARDIMRSIYGELVHDLAGLLLAVPLKDDGRPWTKTDRDDWVRRRDTVLGKLAEIVR